MHALYVCIFHFAGNVLCGKKLVLTCISFVRDCAARFWDYSDTLMEESADAQEVIRCGKFSIFPATTTENEWKWTSHYGTHCFNGGGSFWEARRGNTAAMITKQQRRRHNDNTGRAKYKEAL